MRFPVEQLLGLADVGPETLDFAVLRPDPGRIGLELDLRAEAFRDQVRGLVNRNLEAAADIDDLTLDLPDVGSSIARKPRAVSPTKLKSRFGDVEPSLTLFWPLAIWEIRVGMIARAD